MLSIFDGAFLFKIVTTFSCYFRKKAPRYMFDKVLNAFLLFNFLTSGVHCKRHTYLNKSKYVWPFNERLIRSINVCYVSRTDSHSVTFNIFHALLLDLIIKSVLYFPAFWGVIKSAVSNTVNKEKWNYLQCPWILLTRIQTFVIWNTIPRWWNIWFLKL